MHRPSGLFLARSPEPRFYIGETGGGMGVNYDMPNIGPRVSIYSGEGEMLARLGNRPAGLEPGQWRNRYRDKAPPAGLRNQQKLVKVR